MSKKNFAMSYMSTPENTAANSPAVSEKPKLEKSVKSVREKTESRPDVHSAFRVDAAETKSRRVQLLLKPSDYNKLLKAAKSYGVSVNHVIEEMIAKLL